MTTRETSYEEEQREKRRQRVQQRKRRRKLVNYWVIYPFCILVIAVTIGVNVHYQSDRPRLDAAITQVIESRGGEVIRIVHTGGRGNSGYVEVMFNGQLNRCDLDRLDESPPVFEAKVMEPLVFAEDEPHLDCEPGIIR